MSHQESTHIVMQRRPDGGETILEIVHGEPDKLIYTTACKRLESHVSHILTQKGIIFWWEVGEVFEDYMVFPDGTEYFIRAIQ